MQIKVIRDYSGEEGTGPDKDVLAGSEHHVSRVRGAELFANGLVEILSDDDDAAAGPDPVADADAEDEGDNEETIAPISTNRRRRAPAGKPEA